MKPNVKLVNHTTDALDMLILAKSTRLEMTPGLLEEIKGRSLEDKIKEAEYIANTIPAAWEFVDFTFLVCDVTRAYTHQQVRTRVASYAQQTMRVLDILKGFKYATGPSITEDKEIPNSGHVTARQLYEIEMNSIRVTYKSLIDAGCKIEDARGILPTNIGTNILIKMNLRTLADICRKRSSSRVQDEYREVVRQMKEEALAALPWVQHFIDRTFDRAASEMDAIINDMWENDLPMNADRKMKLIKLLDQMRMQS